MLRPELVRRKLQLIADELGRLTQFRNDSLEQLVSDDIRLTAVERILERVVLRAIDINEHVIASLATGDEARTTRLTYRDTFLRLADFGVYPAGFAQRIAGSAGLRTVIVHEYNDVDHRIVHASITVTLEQYAAYVRLVSDWLSSSQAGSGGVRP